MKGSGFSVRNSCFSVKGSGFSVRDSCFVREGFMFQKSCECSMFQCESYQCDGWCQFSVDLALIPLPQPG